MLFTWLPSNLWCSAEELLLDIQVDIGIAILVIDIQTLKPANQVRSTLFNNKFKKFYSFYHFVHSRVNKEELAVKIHAI